MPAQESCADRGDGKFAIPNSDVVSNEKHKTREHERMAGQSPTDS